MKKLTLLAFMVMFSLTVFSSNNKSTKDEPIDKEILLKSAGDKKKSFTTEKEKSLIDLIEHEKYSSETSVAKDKNEEVAKQTINGENNDKEHQCDGSYTNGISIVDFIKYRSFMRIWLT